jgi:cell division protein FtsZ
MSLLNAFKAANDVLLGAVQGIADLIIRPGMMNVDFADVRTVMSEMGMAMMGNGVARGENRAREAAEKAIRSPLLEDVNLMGARGILVNITAGPDLSLGEFSEVGATIEEFASQDATIVVGTVVDTEMTDDLRVTVVATGLSDAGVQQQAPAAVQSESQAADNAVDFDIPTVMRKKSQVDMRTVHVAQGGASVAAVAATATAEPAEPRKESNLDMLDIPAFLRRQAD